MSRRAEPLDVWAALHGHTIEAWPTGETCTIHGPYAARSLLDADCPHCAAEYDRLASADAHYDHQTSFPRYR